MNAASPSVDPAAPFRVVFDLLPGPLGRCRIAQMLRGVDLGRVVMLRELQNASDDLPQLVDLARSIADPRLCKLLGIVRAAGMAHVASEYAQGISLVELTAELRRTGERLAAPVAARICCEALKGAAAANERLSRSADLTYIRVLFSDTTWVTDYGEVLISEAGIAPSLCRMPSDVDPDEAQRRDVMAACAYLLCLVAGEPEQGDWSAQLATVPTPIATAVLSLSNTPKDELRLAQAVALFEGLPQHLLATEHDVATAIQRVMGRTLQERRRLLGVLPTPGAQIDTEDHTKLFHAVNSAALSALEQLGEDDATVVFRASASQPLLRQEGHDAADLGELPPPHSGPAARTASSPEQAFALQPVQAGLRRANGLSQLWPWLLVAIVALAIGMALSLDWPHGFFSK